MRTPVRPALWAAASCVALLVAGCAMPELPSIDSIDQSSQGDEKKTASLETLPPPSASGQDSAPQPGGASAADGTFVPPAGDPPPMGEGSFPENPGSGPPSDVDTNPPVTLPAGGTGAPSQTEPRSSATRVQLSLGVALPQNLPEVGTSMFFNVNYEFVQGQPSSSTRYFLVITPTRASPIVQQVNVQKRADKLVVIKPGMKPTVGPFRAHMEAATSGGSRRAISQTLMLKSVGRGL